MPSLKEDWIFWIENTEKAFIHVHRASTGFEALTDNTKAVSNIFGDSVAIDHASLEDIMYHLKGGIHHV